MNEGKLDIEGGLCGGFFGRFWTNKNNSNKVMDEIILL